MTASAADIRRRMDSAQPHNKSRPSHSVGLCRETPPGLVEGQILCICAPHPLPTWISTRPRRSEASTIWSTMYANQTVCDGLASCRSARTPQRWVKGRRAAIRKARQAVPGASGAMRSSQKRTTLLPAPSLVHLTRRTGPFRLALTGATRSRSAGVGARSRSANQATPHSN
jgi:hypothetical protein